jgi:hypothetical protein
MHLHFVGPRLCAEHQSLRVPITRSSDSSSMAGRCGWSSTSRGCDVERSNDSEMQRNADEVGVRDKVPAPPEVQRSREFLHFAAIQFIEHLMLTIKSLRIESRTICSNLDGFTYKWLIILALG